MSGSEMSAVERVVEFVSAATLPADAADVIATCHYHDGMGHGVAVLSGADLRAVLAELEQAQATVAHLRGLAADGRGYIEMQRDLLRRKGDVIDNLREQMIPEKLPRHHARRWIARLLAIAAAGGLSSSFPQRTRPGGPSAKNAHQAGLSNTQHG